MLDESFCRTASEAARAAGEVLQQWAHKFTVREKGPANLVTEADYAAQATIVDLIRSRFPDHGFLAEEGLDECPARPAVSLDHRPSRRHLELCSPIPVLRGVDRPGIPRPNRPGRDL